MVQAWFLNDAEVAVDQRNPSKGDIVDLDELKEIGVEYYQVDAETYDSSDVYQSLVKDRGYNYSDQITVSRSTLPEYEKKIKTFFEEHLHTDEEVRFILDGSGYFDVRDSRDRWIRIEVTKNDLIILPAGIYHRFTLDKQDYIKALRLFCGEPVWTPHNRPADEMPQRIAYSQKYGIAAH